MNTNISKLGVSRAVQGHPEQIPFTFPCQTWFDSTAEGVTPNPGHGMLEQTSNEGIVKQSMQASQMSGYAIGLSPRSETPIAVRVQMDGSGGFSTAIILRPGEIISPGGYANGQHRGFTALQWGLPYGWLGGGFACLVVFRSPDSLPRWDTGREVIFHRFQTSIRSAALAAAAPQRRNWPTRFPWPHAFQAVNINIALDRSGSPLLAVHPTKTLLRLNGNVGMPVGETCRLVMYGSECFDLAPLDGLTTLASGTAFWDFNWPANNYLDANGVPWPTHNPYIRLPDEISDMAANAWGIEIQTYPAGPLIEKTVNVVRYGKI